MPITLPFPLAAIDASSWQDANSVKVASAKNKNTTFHAIVRFASSSLGKNTTAKLKKKKTTSVSLTTPSWEQRRTSLARAHARPIEKSSQLYLQKSFAKAASEGAIKKPVIHVEFDAPTNCKECFNCKSQDLLYVFVGLCNVFLLQFVMVVLLFFTQIEVNLSEMLKDR